jgi:hypothetical protein
MTAAARSPAIPEKEPSSKFILAVGVVTALGLAVAVRLVLLGVKPRAGY